MSIPSADFPALRSGEAVRPRSPDAAERSLDELVEFEVLDLFARSPAGLAAGVVPLAIAVALLQVLAAPPPLLLPWALAVALVLGSGIALSFAYRRSSPRPNDTARWRRRYLILTSAGGLAWGSAGWLFVPAPWPVEMMIFALLAGLSVAVLADVGANVKFFAAFVSGAWLPTVLYRTVLGGALNLGLSLGALVTMLALTLFASRLATAMRRSLRIGHENKRLAQALAERTREAEQASLAKSRFIAAASHDLRQPVHALGLLLDVMQGQPASPQAQATAARMSHVLNSLNSLFEGLLDISRLDSGAVEPRRADFALGPLLAALGDEFAAEAEAKGLSLRCRGSDDWIHSDPMLLERMLRNLLANAVRYTARGGIVIGCRRRGMTLSIEIWDSGIGIAAAQQATVFDEFYQVANPGRARDQGLGLGLAIVRRLGALLGHPLELRSRIGRGSVLRIGVPVVVGPAAPPAAAIASPGSQMPESTWRGRRVLVVDDDALARDALSRWLGAWGCRVTACADAEAVRAALDPSATAPDALITDWRLPGAEDGLDVTRRVRQRFGAKLPAILITGDALDDARRVAREHGVVLLHKPVRPAALRAALAAHWLRAPIAAAAIS